MCEACAEKGRIRARANTPPPYLAQKGAAKMAMMERARTASKTAGAALPSKADESRATVVAGEGSLS